MNKHKNKFWIFGGGVLVITGLLLGGLGVFGFFPQDRRRPGQCLQAWKMTFGQPEPKTGTNHE